MKILFYTKKNKNSKYATIQTRVTIGGIRANPYSTGITTLVTEWNGKDQKIVTKDKARKELVEEHNKALKKIETQLTKTYNELQENSSIPVVTAKRVIEETYQPKINKKTFLELMQPCFDYLHQRHQHAENTIRTYNIRAKNIRMFFENQKIVSCYCEELTPAMLEQFCVWLMKTKQASASHINKNVEVIQKVVKWAKFNGFASKNEISDFEKQKIKKKEIEYVEMDVILEIYNKDIPDVAWRKIIDVFTFQCLTSLDYCDVKLFNNSNIYEGLNGEKRIKIVRKKSTKQKDLIQDLPFIPLAKQIWEKYKGKFPLICLDKYNQYLQQIYPFYGVTLQMTHKMPVAWMWQILWQVIKQQSPTEKLIFCFISKSFNALMPRIWLIIYFFLVSNFSRRDCTTTVFLLFMIMM